MRSAAVVMLACVFGISVEAGDRAAFEAVLVPVWNSGPGAHGSDWTSIMRIYNDATTAAAFAHPVYVDPCPLGAPCPAPVPPKAVVNLGIGPNQPTGIILYAPRSHVSALFYELRVRDVSRQAQTWGTEIPVVKETSFTPAELHMLDVPTAATFRSTLRVYALSFEPPRARLQVFSQAERSPTLPVAVPEVLVDDVITLTRPFPEHNGAVFPLRPAFFALHDLAGRYPELRRFEKVRVTVSALDGLSPLWSFVAVTNNETQHVTTITPDR